MFGGPAAPGISSKVLILDFVSDWGTPLAASSNVLVEENEDREDGRGEGGAMLKGAFSSFIFCCSPFCFTLFRRKSANEAAGLLVAGDRSGAGEEGGGGGGGGKVKECWTGWWVMEVTLG